RETRERDLVLRMVEVEDLPPRAEVRPGGDAVSRDQKPALGPPERQVARRVAGRVHHLQRPERVAFVEQLGDGAGRVPRPGGPEPELERDQLQRLVRHVRARLGASLAGDDVCLPAVRVDGRPPRKLESGESAEVGAMSVGDRNPLDVVRGTSELSQCVEDEPGVALEERVDDRKLAACLEQKGMDVAALAVTEAEDPRCELLHAVAAAAAFCAPADGAATRLQGANGFPTPSSDGASSGKWRRSTLRMLFDSTQSMPAWV